MKKFFLFRREEINKASVHSSDMGEGLSVFAVPTDNVSFLTAVKGFVNITFNGSGMYEDVGLFSGESIEKTSVSVSCTEGQEMAFIENIINFISRDTTEQVMKFDVVEKSSTFKKSTVLNKTDVRISLKENASDIGNPQKDSLSEARNHNNVIAGISFNKNMPIIDYNHEWIEENFTSGQSVSNWKNSGSGGDTYSIVSATGTVKTLSNADVSRISKASMQFSHSTFFTIPNSFTVKADYTIYFAAHSRDHGYKPLFGDSEGETVGFCGDILEVGSTRLSAGATSSAKSSAFTMRHSGVSALPATSSSVDNDWTDSFVFPDKFKANTAGNSDHDQHIRCDVFVIRRDKDYNLFLHNRDGNIISFIPAKTRKDDPTFTSRTSFLTDGDLLIQNLGGYGGLTTNTFEGYLGRFGVIDKNIGLNAATKLAKDLSSFYDPSPINT
tara:strand:- start:1934 stop:3256 length:1323 start_codon:yes stop_codon:yes gene_type:complete